MATGDFFIMKIMKNLPTWCFFAVVLDILFCATPSPALVISQQPAAGVDNIPPAPASHIQASDRADDSGGHILVTWVPSLDDQAGFSVLMNGTYEASSGIVVYPTHRGILGYRIYRSADRATTEFVGQEPVGSDRFLDEKAEDGVTYSYEVRAFDASHETSPSIIPGSSADLARTAQAFDNTFIPTDAGGNPVAGWFNRQDPTVGFDDFFLFIDHFGQVDGEVGFDSQYDLNDDHRVNFADFFIFVDHFGTRISNFDELLIN
jgi:hypothetical protein